MAISVKSKFAGFLRGLLRRVDDREPAQPVAVGHSQPGTRCPGGFRAGANKLRFRPPRPTPDEIELPMAAVLASLPMDLRAKLIAAPPAGVILRLPAEMVIGQLAFGAVKISFGELRRLAPGVFVNSGGELDKQTGQPAVE